MEKLNKGIKLDKQESPPTWLGLLTILGAGLLVMFVVFYFGHRQDEAKKDASYDKIMPVAQAFQKKYNIEGELDCYVRDTYYWYADCTVWREAKWPYEFFCHAGGCRCVNHSRYDENRPGSCSEMLEQISYPVSDQ